MLKKSLAFITLTGLLMTTVSFAHAEEITNSGAQFFKTVGIIEGRNGDLALSTPINRAEMMKIIAMIATEKSEIVAHYSSFDDVDQSEWYAPYAMWGYRNSVINGVQKSSANDDQLIYQIEFQGNRSVTAAEALKIVTEAFHIPLVEREEQGEWFQVYYDTLLEKNLIDSTMYKRLPYAMSRGDVLDLVYKAMVLKESGKIAYEVGDGQGFPMIYAKKINEQKAMTMTEGQNMLKQIIEAQLAYGFQPTAEKSNGSLHIEVKDQEGKGTDTAVIDLTLTLDDWVKGTKEILEGTELLFTTAAKVNIDTKELKVKGDFAVRARLMVDGPARRVYVRLDDWTQQNVEASDDVKQQISEAEAMVKPYVAKWYSFTIPAETFDQIMGTNASEAAKTEEAKLIKVGEMVLSALVVTVTKEAQLDVLRVQMTSEGMKKVMHEMRKMDGMSYNKYDVEGVDQKTEMLLSEFASRFAWTVKANNQTHLITSMNALLAQWIIQPETTSNDPVVTIQGRSDHTMMYDMVKSFVFPVDAQDITSVFSFFL